MIDNAEKDTGCPWCDRLNEQIEALANLAAEHRNCSGCPTPWWLINWLDTERATRPLPPESGES